MSDDYYNAWSLIKRLYHNYIKTYRSKIIIALVFMVIVALTNAMHVYIIKPALDDIFIKNDQKLLVILPIIIIIISIVKAVASYAPKLLYEVCWSAYNNRYAN